MSYSSSFHGDTKLELLAVEQMMETITVERDRVTEGSELVFNTILGQLSSIFGIF